MNNNQNYFKGKLLFKKYRILKLIDKGTFASIYLGQNIINHKLYAIKCENISDQILEEEAFILYNLKGFGIPEVISFGRYGKYNILIQTLLGKSLEKIWIENNKIFNIKDICMIAIQTLDRIEYIHSKNYLHRDIKPSNFLVGNPDNSIVYLVDFGNSRKYRSSRTGKHIQSIKINRIFGTTIFLSLSSTKGNEQSRKDDLESLGYMYIYLFKGGLPWSNIKHIKIEEIIRKTIQMKEKTSFEDLSMGLPKEFCTYMNYVKKLNFDQDPDYNYLKSLFINLLTKIGLKNDNLFSWVDENKIPRIKRKKYIYKRKSSPQVRLLNKIIRSNSSKIFGTLKSSNNNYPSGEISVGNNSKNKYEYLTTDINNKINNSKENNIKKLNRNIINNNISKGLKTINFNNININIQKYYNYIPLNKRKLVDSNKYNLKKNSLNNNHSKINEKNNKKKVIKIMNKNMFYRNLLFPSPLKFLQINKNNMNYNNRYNNNIFNTSANNNSIDNNYYKRNFYNNLTQNNLYKSKNMTTKNSLNINNNNQRKLIQIKNNNINSRNIKNENSAEYKYINAKSYRKQLFLNLTENNLFNQ